MAAGHEQICRRGGGTVYVTGSLLVNTCRFDRYGSLYQASSIKALTVEKMEMCFVHRQVLH
jgi:hypothetical protein